MKKMPNSKKTGGFTLVELLVVIAIIALLLAVLMPALNKAREQGKNVVCKGNNKQLMVAATMWSQDNGDWTLPQKWDRDSGRNGQYEYRLNKYLDVSSGESGDNAYYKGVYLCPSLGGKKAQTLRLPTDPLFVFTQCLWVNSYGINRYLCGSGPGPGTDGLAPWQYGPDSVYWDQHGSTKTLAIRRPASAIYFMDSSIYIAWDFIFNAGIKTTQIGMGRRHMVGGSRPGAGKANIAWCDGHVSGEPSDFELRSPLRKTGYIINDAYFYGK